MSAVAQLQTQVDQLRQEASLNRLKLSESLKELIDYIEKARALDPFIAGISQADNPFKDQKGCLIL